MAITFACSCGAKLQAKDDKAGSSLPCPKCGETVTVPGDEREQPDFSEGAFPVLKRRAFTESAAVMPIASTVNSASASQSEQPYQSCRVMCGVFVVSGYGSFLLAFLFACLAGWIVTQLGDVRSGVNFSQAITLGTASFSLVVMGFFQLASAELLGGAVAFLLKNDCKP